MTDFKLFYAYTPQEPVVDNHLDILSVSYGWSVKQPKARWLLAILKWRYQIHIIEISRFLILTLKSLRNFCPWFICI